MASVFKTVTKDRNSEKEEDIDMQDLAQARKENKQRVLTLCSRGVTFRQRHLLSDLLSLMPHARKDAKLDTKSNFGLLTELADLHNCNNILFFEARKRQDLYVWISKAPNGPTVKMHVQNMHTMNELHFTGNCLKGSRPILSFDESFDSAPHWQLLREMLTHVFGVPKGARKSKPFIDHVTSFTVADGKIWYRNYEIKEEEPVKKSTEGMTEEEAAAQRKKEKKTDTELSLVEIGPRVVFTPIVIQEGCFGGPIIYENKEFVSPNQVRADLLKKKAGKHLKRVDDKVKKAVKTKELTEKRVASQQEMLDSLFK